MSTDTVIPAFTNTEIEFFVNKCDTVEAMQGYVYENFHDIGPDENGVTIMQLVLRRTVDNVFIASTYKYLPEKSEIHGDPKDFTVVTRKMKTIYYYK